jgi:3-oxoacyl-[acyl-carrier protein] reductase
MKHPGYIVTGAAGGIGQVVVSKLAARGDRVLATDVSLEMLQTVAARCAWPPDTVTLRALDVRDEAAWGRVLGEVPSALGSLDAVFNIAGWLKPGYVGEIDPADIARHFDINVRGVILGTTLTAAWLKAHPEARGAAPTIVNVGSLASLAPVPGLALYSASKYAVRGFSLAAREDLKPHGLRVTVVCPDAVATPMLDLQKAYAESRLTFSGPRVLTAGEVADVLVGRALRDAPGEIWLPPSRGVLARVGDLLPWLAPVLAPLLLKAGEKKQARYQVRG